MHVDDLHIVCSDSTASSQVRYTSSSKDSAREGGHILRVWWLGFCYLCTQVHVLQQLVVAITVYILILI